MHVIVLGAGVIGVTTAWHLREAGCDVTVIEREADVAQATSLGNAGVIAPGYVTPWAAPGMPGKILKYLFKPASPLIFRPTLDAAQWRWIARWLRECEFERFRVNKQRMQRIAYYSRACLHAFRDRYPFDYGASRGYLQLLRSAFDVEMVQPALKVLRDAGIAFRELDAAGCTAIEPGLRWARQAPVGGIYLPDDEAGDCARFTRELRARCEANGVTFRFRTAIRALDVAGGEVRGVRIDSLDAGAAARRDALLAADAIVVALGVDSAGLLRPLGIDVPLYPVKGYSATLAVVDDEKAPCAALMDESLKTAITRFGPTLRVAGTAELGNRHAALRQQALDTLMKVLDDWFPHAADRASARFWVGRRPMTPDGPPLLGASGIDGLWLNVGHGSTGWAMSMGSGKVVADLVTGRAPEIDLAGLTLARYDR
ncbi:MULTISPECIES: D-amino acid dehydrogenase [Burkholderia]|jgi:D-amino-acid dehydrogenase|uniref:D-amino acid dehydrogenase subunit n=1 Tax=Burkholderia cenocepacia (strain ATCC BAA-245 / DSM 16553 / LMG 16656 / NCTC 13227 / J2315 / CF5610) TaxID=216591 RepID=B4E616_BURCJ|nr:MULTISPECIES: D-amino acid dehydrogenase [Burkholderia]AIO48203.1 ketopantoate reductase PanE/ApbA family protein [Burkholderia cepacia]ALV57883.1 amino acid dehydrogenase [Burkholderia cenocepacia]AMU16128.1 amino acid dehydrogenase [Burkholderia cenocepacia]AOK33048.1 amino acid dehydrogenase [Burkholderia cenocepacia]AQQ18888.1 amino acid dehydrogenase [Burkholderia cenocepacia]